MASLTRKDQRLLLRSSLTFFVVLLALFSLAAVFGERLYRPFVDPILWLANIIAAVSAGIIASALTRFMDLTLRQNLGPHWPSQVRAGGALAVFVIVLLINPRVTMKDAADYTFTQAASECMAAIADRGSSAASGVVCDELVRSFPENPQSWYLRGVLRYRGAQSIPEHERAFDNFAYAATLAFNGRSLGTVGAAELGPEATRSSFLIDLLMHYGSALADLSLLKLKEGVADFATIAPALDQAEHSISLAVALLEPHEDPSGLSRGYDFLGRLAFYRAFLEPGADPLHRLTLAADHFARAARPVADRSTKFLPMFYELYTSVVIDARAGGRWSGRTLSLSTGIITEQQRYFRSTDPNLVRDFGAAARYLKQVFSNVRPDAYLITAPLGSTEFGGPEFQSFLVARSGFRETFLATLQ